MKYNFDTAAKYAVDSEKKTGNLWCNLSGYIGELAQFHDVDNIKAVLKNSEKSYGEINKVKLSSIGAYRSAKSVAIKACSLGVKLLDDNGNSRGKTEVEKEIKENKEEKPVADKLQTAANTMNSIMDQIDDIDDARIAIILIDMLREKAANIVTEFSEDVTAEQ